MNRYQLTVKELCSQYSFEPSRVERLCQLIEDAGEYYISLIFEDSFCQLKWGSYIKSLYKVHKETDCLVKKYEGHIIDVDHRVITYYNKCPHCDYVAKMVNQSKYEVLYKHDPVRQKKNIRQKNGSIRIKIPQPSCIFIKHVNKKHGTNFMINKSTKSYYNKEKTHNRRQAVHQIV